MKKYCYICIPIAGRESDVFERAAKAAKEIENLGYIPLSPLDLNKIGEKELVNHTEIQMTAWYMGRDIDMIIRDCDAIYCCEGWEYSKGCNVERECAKQYNRDIFYQIPYDERNDLKVTEAFDRKYYELLSDFAKFARSEKQGPNSDVCQSLLNMMNKLENFAKNYFDLYYDDNAVKFTFTKKS